MLKTPQEETCFKAKQCVYRLLNFRFRSEFEIREKLKNKEFDTACINKVVDYFKKLELIDDQKFTHSWITSRLKKPFGLRRIRMELNRKGIDQAIIDAQCAAFDVELDEEAIVIEAARRRSGKYKNIDEQKKRQRLYGYLSRRGFSAQSIIKALRKL